MLRGLFGWPSGYPFAVSRLGLGLGRDNCPAKGRDGHPQGPNAQGGPPGGAPRHNRFYALQMRQGADEAPDVVTGMLKVYDLNVYALLDPGATLSFISPFVANRLHACPEILCEPIEVSTPIGESIL
ncbi:retropepsin-like aspartic protease, partial [Microbacterium sp. C7(2022)]|uniref:retropepsin-like aspartic protease n=1 Tax=Microbacterium sp. C7(2022) TaxID=2992759 RepID=UPI0034D42545